jgi:tRNA (guanine-N7-)-methyltransferase
VSENELRSERGRFFGRAKGKALRKGQVDLFETLLPALRIPDGDSEIDLAGLFLLKPANYRLEIGFGGGEHLLKRALEFPETGFIGCEPFVNGMAKLLKEIRERGIRNIRLYDKDATFLLRRLPKAQISMIELLYPDPWPKRRQRKRRFVSEESLDLIARALTPGGSFRFASDIDDYVGWTLVRTLPRKDIVWQAAEPKDWITPYEGWIRTRYEAKAVREGRSSAYLTFVRSAD